MLWKILTIVLAMATVGLLTLLWQRGKAQVALYEPRLIGTWVSDKNRTLEHLTDAQKESLGELFGKLKVTYGENTYTTELDDDCEIIPYTVIGQDLHSVVIRDDSEPDPDNEFLELSTFTKIQFDGSDSYWVVTAIGGLTEFFRRVTRTENQ
jgi:hypothetical protein